MGIPYYFYTLTKKYNTIVSSILPIKVDIYFMDFNSIIHPICDKLDNIIENNVYEELYKKIEKDIKMLNPKKTYICVDGVAPLAKMIQQRKRRYLTVYKNKLDGIKNKWDKNAITPGTKFMKNMDKYFKNRLEELSIHYSGSDENGEGEHKIFNFLSNDINTDNENIVINGLDADLIILSLLSHKKIFLMREGEELSYVNILELRKAIIHELKIKWELSEIINEDDIIETYCVMCSLLGNDFIPHLLTLNLKNNGLDTLMTFTGNSYKNIGQLLVENNKINYVVLGDILQQLSMIEDVEILKETEIYIKKKVYDVTNTSSELYGIKNKDIIANSIYAGISKWRQIYYKSLFNTNILITSTVLTQICKNYIEGIYWTYAYYKKQSYDNTWFYAYPYPPSIKDMSNYIIGNNEIKMSSSNLIITPEIQLMIVLPRESIELIDDKYKKYLTDKSLGLYHLYPSKYIIRTYLKTHLWECIPILPNVNISHLKKYIK